MTPQRPREPRIPVQPPKPLPPQNYQELLYKIPLCCSKPVSLAQLLKAAPPSTHPDDIQVEAVIDDDPDYAPRVNHYVLSVWRTLKEPSASEVKQYNLALAQYEVDVEKYRQRLAQYEKDMESYRIQLQTYSEQSRQEQITKLRQQLQELEEKYGK
jgi:hypothetical protein